MKFRKKPVVIDAFLWTGIHSDIPYWASDEFVIDDGNLYIKTLEGEMKASIGDWVIRGVAGEYYPCKPDIFAATYEPAEPCQHKGWITIDRCDQRGAWVGPQP